MKFFFLQKFEILHLATVFKFILFTNDVINLDNLNLLKIFNKLQFFYFMRFLLEISVLCLL